MFDPVSIHKLSEAMQAERVEHLLHESEKSPFPGFGPALRFTGRLLVRAGLALQGPAELTVVSSAEADEPIEASPVAAPTLIPVARWRLGHTDNSDCERRAPINSPH